MTDIFLVTASKMPKPDRETHLLQDQLTESGISSKIVVWDDKGVQWEESKLCIIRTPWDYYKRVDEFILWLEATKKKTTIWNPIEIIKWNYHKAYMLELESKGVPIVPTKVLKKGSTLGLNEILADKNWPEIIIKPAISLGAVGSGRFKHDDPSAQTHFSELVIMEDVLIQAFVPEIIDKGEISMIFFENKFSHAVRKNAKKGDYRVQDDHGGKVQKYQPTSSEIEFGLTVFKAFEVIIPYARVDFVQTESGPQLMELELIEPELFFAEYPERLSIFTELISVQLN